MFILTESFSMRPPPNPASPVASPSRPAHTPCHRSSRTLQSLSHRSYLLPVFPSPCVCHPCPIPIHYRSRDHQKAHELTNHIMHSSIARTRGDPAAVSGCAPKEAPQVVRNCSFITDRGNRRFSQDILNGDDIKTGFLTVSVVKSENRF